MEKVLELDERRRTNLGKFGNPEHRRYIVTEEPDGTLILTPAVVMAEHEARLLANRTVMARIAETTAHPEKLVKRPSRGKRGG